MGLMPMEVLSCIRNDVSDFKSIRFQKIIRYFMFRIILFCFSVFLGMCHSLAAYELVVMAMFRNEAHHLKEWVEYHRMIGVDYFLLYDDESTDNWREVLDPYIKEGIVKAIDWSKQHVGQHHRIAQVKAYRDALGQIVGRTKWLTAIDIDEFLLPMKEKTIPECLEKHFSDAKAIYVNWRNFGTSGSYIEKGHPILFQLTACSLKNHSDNSIGKSIVRPEYVRISDVWYVHHFPLVPGAYYVNGDGQPMQFRGVDLLTDALHHGNHIRINHYVLGDEERFQKYRIPRARGQERETLMGHYLAFSLIKDYTIGKLIQQHQNFYERVWKPYVESK